MESANLIVSKAGAQVSPPGDHKVKAISMETSDRHSDNNCVFHGWNRGRNGRDVRESPNRDAVNSFAFFADAKAYQRA